LRARKLLQQALRLLAPGAEAAGKARAAAARRTEGQPLSLRLREGPYGDTDFDEVLPVSARRLSSAFWSPVAVARRAAELLVQGASTRVLDVGSGVGKFCIVGAASTNATFVGIEHRRHLVDLAREAARRLEVHSAQFIHGTLEVVETSDFDAFYFFNPFEENLCGRDEHMDQTVPLSRGRYFADLKRAQRMLARARIGTRVVTYHGLGGVMPGGYILSHQEPLGSNYLKVWVKTDSVTRFSIPSAHTAAAGIPAS
jgi:SAM-dependent methyltransferase